MRAHLLSASLVLALSLPLVPVAASEDRAVLTDPTRPPATPTGEPAAEAARIPQVSMLRLSGSQPLAVVDGQTVRVGDRLSLGTIRAIGPEGVSVATDDGDLTLPMASRIELDLRRSE